MQNEKNLLVNHALNKILVTLTNQEMSNTKEIEKDYLVSTSPHMSPENDPSSFCSPATSESNIKLDKTC